jgi:hypothetical protein
MTKALDTEFALVATELVAEFPADATFTVLGERVYDPDTSQVYEGAMSTVSTTVSVPQPYSDTYVDGDIIRRGDTRTFLPSTGATFTPIKGQAVEVSGRMWTIVQVNPLPTGDDFAGWELHLRA